MNWSHFFSKGLQNPASTSMDVHSPKNTDQRLKIEQQIQVLKRTGHMMFEARK
jgi:hypothetical protein